MKTILLVFIIILSGCTKQVYIPVESVRTEYRDLHTRDSIYLRDSVFMLQKGDTVLIEKYRYLYKDKLIRDSVYINDTICIPYPVEKIVSVNKQKWYQETLMYIGLVTLLALIGYLGFNKIRK